MALATDKDDIMVEYALGLISNQLFVSRYQLYLPEKAWLVEKISAFLDAESHPHQERE